MKYASIANKKHYMDKFSYSIGLGIGQNLSSMGIANLSVDDFAQAIKDVLEGNQTAISHTEAREIVNKYFEELEQKMNAANIEAGKVYARETEQVWQCRNCGYTYIGQHAPLKCPVCAHPQSYFELKSKNY